MTPLRLQDVPLSEAVRACATTTSLSGVSCACGSPAYVAVYEIRQGALAYLELGCLTCRTREAIS